jgi:hypothetical protein
MVNKVDVDYVVGYHDIDIVVVIMVVVVGLEDGHVVHIEDVDVLHVIVVHVQEVEHLDLVCGM